MIKEVFGRALSVLAKKPIRLWGISLLGGVLSGVFAFLFSIPLGLSIMIAMLLETSGPRISNAKRNANRKLFGDEEGQWLRKRLVEIEYEGEELNL